MPKRIRTEARGHVLPSHGTLLQCPWYACYAMPSTHVACGATALRANYAMSGTDLARVMTPGFTVLRFLRVFRSIYLHARYAMSSTDMVYGAIVPWGDT
eukprot:3085458-Rhodomonas_salina.1